MKPILAALGATLFGGGIVYAVLRATYRLFGAEPTIVFAVILMGGILVMLCSETEA